LAASGSQSVELSMQVPLVAQTMPVPVQELEVHRQFSVAGSLVGVWPVQAGVQTAGLWQAPSAPQVLPALQEPWVPAVPVHLQVVPTQLGVSPVQAGVQVLGTQTPATQVALVPHEDELHWQTVPTQVGVVPVHAGLQELGMQVPSRQV
jgi:hypothetical protein